MTSKDDETGHHEGDTEAQGLTLEEKYAAQMRQIVSTRIDIPLLTLTSQIDAQIDLNPHFQRRDRWDLKRRSRFIESLIMNVPVPPVFLGEVDYGRFVVLDGRQRLTTLYQFLKSEFRLRELKVWPELNQHNYSDLKERGLAVTLERRFLPAVVLTRESSPQVKYDVFDRLNTGGMIANKMEVRNAVFPGKFRELIHELSANSDFRSLWGIPDPRPGTSEKRLRSNNFYRTMQDLEMVLRFFALSNATLNGLTFSAHLSQYMAEQNKAYEADTGLHNRDKARFERAASSVASVFGADAFRNAPGSRGRLRSKPYGDALMIAMAHPRAQALREEDRAKVRAQIQRLHDEPDFVHALMSGTNGQDSISTRITMAKSAVALALDK